MENIVPWILIGIAVLLLLVLLEIIRLGGKIDQIQRIAGSREEFDDERVIKLRHRLGLDLVLKHLSELHYLKRLQLGETWIEHQEDEASRPHPTAPSLSELEKRIRKDAE